MSDVLANEQTYGTGKKKLGVYVTGMILCIILTLVPFISLMYDVLSDTLKVTIIFISAILQFLVQVICFLGLNAKNEESRINLMSFIFTLIVLVVLVGGSVWIMWSLHCNMMIMDHGSM